MPLNTLHCIIFSDCFLHARFSALFGKAEVRIVVIDRYRRKQRKRRCLGGNGGGRGRGGGAVLNKALHGQAPLRGLNPYPFIYYF